MKRSGEMTKPARRIMRQFRLDEISMVDQPAQEPARMTLLKRKSGRITKKIGDKKFFVKDFAYVKDENDPTTWKMRLTDKPNGKPTPVRVNAAIKNFLNQPQRYQIPPDALESILDKLREAWMKAFPGKDPNTQMPPELADPANTDAADAVMEDEELDENGNTIKDEELDENGDPIEEEEVDEDGNPIEDEEKVEDEEMIDDEEEEDEEVVPPKKKPKPKASTKRPGAFKSLADRILKGYIDTTEGAKTFGEVLEICRTQDEFHEILDKAWPVLSALDQSLRSIVGDPDIDSTAKHTMLRSSVEGFLAAIKDVMPEVEEAIEKALTTEKSKPEGESNMTMKASGGDNLQKQFDELKKNFEASEKAREEAVAKAARLEAVAALTADEKDYYDKANDKAKEEFLAMNKSDRSKTIKKAIAEDETVELDGQVFSKSNTDPAMWAFIKSQAAKMEQLAKQLDDERSKRESAELSKRVKEELGHLPGTDEEKLELLKSIEAMPETQRKTMQTILKSANSTASIAFQRLGSNGGQNLNKRNGEPHSFEKSINEIRTRDGCSRQDAIRKARRENPQAFEEWNNGVETSH